MPRIIEWEEHPWNPVTGCSPVSEGCAHCYALQRAQQLEYQGNPHYTDGFTPTLHEDRMTEKYLKRYPPSRIFVNSMSDLFHEQVPTEFIQRAFRIIARNRRHLFMILTKREERLATLHQQLSWPDNLLMGVTVENHRHTNRIAILQQTAARYKIIFFEPLLDDVGTLDLNGIQWAFVGGESGAGCRPMDRDWVLNIKRQCDDQGCTFVFKQWGGVNRTASGALLDGRYYDELPTVENCLDRTTSGEDTQLDLFH